MDASTAIALMVKTPGHSPVKTRLAKRIGTERAHAFHRLSASAMAETLRECAEKFPERISPYWAVAEDDADAEWSDFPVLHQGSGSFGERMAQMYRRLRIRHHSVILAAADSPEITSAVWLSAWKALQMPGSVLGPAADGGFYLVGSNLDVPDSLWRALPLSTPKAAPRLFEELTRLGPCHKLSVLDDIDEPKDLIRLTERLAARPDLPEGLARLAEWAANQGGSSASNLPG